jgi:hypothetical protein
MRAARRGPVPTRAGRRGAGHLGSGTPPRGRSRSRGPQASPRRRATVEAHFG